MSTKRNRFLILSTSILLILCMLAISIGVALAIQQAMLNSGVNVKYEADPLSNCENLIFGYADNYQDIIDNFEETPVSSSKYMKIDVTGGIENGGISSFYDSSTKTKYFLKYKADGDIYPPSTNCEYLFKGLTGLISIKFENYNTSSVTNMGRMFYNCSSLESLDVSNFNTSNVTSMWNMFYHCSSLKSLDVSNFNTSNVNEMQGMFHSCSGLTTLNLSNFRTLKSVAMNHMFLNCYQLKNIIFSTTTKKVTAMQNMFSGCAALTTLDLSSFNTLSVDTMQEMFYGCYRLTKICVGSGWSTASVTNSDDMFKYCTSLIGGAGTTFNSSYIDKTYARIDDPDNGKPGYFTDIKDKLATT